MSFRCEVYNRKHNIQSVKNVFTNMLIAAQSRGSAATGVVVTSCPPGAKKATTTLLRAPLPANEFVETSDYKELIAKVDTNCLSIIGHTRAATGGASASAINNTNNHPHVHGGLLGVHNGCVLNHVDLWEKYADQITPKGGCDSEVIVAIINHLLSSGEATSMEDAIKSTIDMTNMWYALAIINIDQPEKVYLVKDKSTPLTLGWWNTPEIAVFASNWEYVDKAYKDAMTYACTTSPIKRCTFPAEQIITLDSTIRGNKWEDLFVSRYSLKSDKKSANITKENQAAFNITQGE